MDESVEEETHSLHHCGNILYVLIVPVRTCLPCVSKGIHEGGKKETLQKRNLNLNVAT